jgi:hypothetical protein
VHFWWWLFWGWSGVLDRVDFLWLDRLLLYLMYVPLRLC